MHCPNCGFELSDLNSKFCPNCGKPLGQRTQYEVCKLDCFIVGQTSNVRLFATNFLPLQVAWFWVAEAVGPKGNYVAAESREFKAYINDAINKPRSLLGGKSLECESAHDEIVARLLEDGWYPIDTRYYGQSFQRSY